MSKFDGLLFCTDLDGTLLDDSRNVSQQNLRAIEYFKSQGGRFTFITGRVPMTADKICRIISLNAPYGCLNGGGIFDPAANAYLWNALLPNSALELVRTAVQAFSDIDVQYVTKSGVYTVRGNDAMQGFRTADPPVLPCCDPLCKIVFAHNSDECILALADHLARHPNAGSFDFIRSERTLYEILPKGVSKGTVMLKIAALLGIDPAKTIAVGDYNNDVSMLSAAGLSFAVANAVPAAKAAAHHLTVCNNDHAIAAIIGALDLGLHTL